MTQEQEAVLMIRGSIASLTEKDQKLVKIAKEELVVLLNRHGDYGYMALVEIGAEIAAKAIE